MPGSAATSGWFNWQGMWEASIPAFDGEVRRRPYHRNCSCALHRSRTIPADAPCPASSTVSYPIRRRASSWHSITSSSSSNSLAGEASPQTSIEGNVYGGESSAVVFTIESFNQA